MFRDQFLKNLTFKNILYVCDNNVTKKIVKTICPFIFIKVQFIFFGIIHHEVKQTRASSDPLPSLTLK